MSKLGTALNRLFPSGTKIADINESDTATHSVTCATLGLPLDCVAIYISPITVSGSGAFEIRMASDGTAYALTDGVEALWFRAEDGLYYYEQTVADSDYDIHALGYFVEYNIHELLGR